MVAAMSDHSVWGDAGGGRLLHTVYSMNNLPILYSAKSFGMQHHIPATTNNNGTCAPALFDRILSPPGPDPTIDLWTSSIEN